jgi:hypothetical protein
MPNLAAARAEVERIEAFLRTRYHYPHPIFERVAALAKLLEDEPEPPGETAAEAVTQVADAPEGTPPEPAKRARSRPRSKETDE